MSYESIARIERVSKSTQTEIFRFEKSFLQNKNKTASRSGMCIQPRGATHVHRTSDRRTLDRLKLRFLTKSHQQIPYAEIKIWGRLRVT